MTKNILGIIIPAFLIIFTIFYIVPEVTNIIQNKNIEAEPIIKDYYTGTLRDIQIHKVFLSTTTSLFFEDGQIFTINKTFKNLRIGNKYTITYNSFLQSYDIKEQP